MRSAQVSEPQRRSGTCCEAAPRACSSPGCSRSRRGHPAQARSRARRATPRSSRWCRRPASRRTSTCTPTAACTPAATSTPAARRPRRSSSGAPTAPCCARGPCPGQVLGEDHGVQVANQTHDGKLVLLETSTASILTLDAAHRPVPAAWSASPTGAVPNYATWGPRRRALRHRLRRGRDLEGAARLAHAAALVHLAGARRRVEFGTTGIRYRPGRDDLLITQQTVDRRRVAADQRPPLPAAGRRRRPSPGALQTLWTSRARRPARRLRDRTVRPRVRRASPGSSNQLVELTRHRRTEVHAASAAALTGDNGSPVPFDTPCSATFLGTRVLVANQSADRRRRLPPGRSSTSRSASRGCAAYLAEDGDASRSLRARSTPARTTITSGRLAATSCQVSPESAEPQTLPLRPPK